MIPDRRARDPRERLPSRRLGFAAQGRHRDHEVPVRFGNASLVDLSMVSLAVMNLTKAQSPCETGREHAGANHSRDVIAGAGGSHTQAALASCEVVTLP